jgi:hypothetical protein
MNIRKPIQGVVDVRTTDYAAAIRQGLKAFDDLEATLFGMPRQFVAELTIRYYLNNCANVDPWFITDVILGLERGQYIIRAPVVADLPDQSYFAVPPYVTRDMFAALVVVLLERVP